MFRKCEKNKCINAQHNMNFHRLDISHWNSSKNINIFAWKENDSVIKFPHLNFDADSLFSQLLDLHNCVLLEVNFLTNRSRKVEGNGGINSGISPLIFVNHILHSRMYKVCWLKMHIIRDITEWKAHNYNIIWIGLKCIYYCGNGFHVPKSTFLFACDALLITDHANIYLVNIEHNFICVRIVLYFYLEIRSSAYYNSVIQTFTNNI